MQQEIAVRQQKSYCTVLFRAKITLGSCKKTALNNITSCSHVTRAIFSLLDTSIRKSYVENRTSVVCSILCCAGGEWNALLDFLRSID
jgi:hypothetical protein